MNIEPTDKEWAAGQLNAYRQAAALWHTHADAAFEARSDIQRIKQEMEQVEATIVVNGGFAHLAIDGKNAEQRAAQLTACLAQEGSYQELTETLRDLERDLSRANTAQEDASNAMRVSRVALDYATAYLNREAAAFGSEGALKR